MMSREAGGVDIGDNLIGKMARQIGLSRSDFLRLVDCPMIREEFDREIAKREASKD
jgi:hypothetical protein